MNVRRVTLALGVSAISLLVAAGAGSAQTASRSGLIEGADTTERASWADLEATPNPVHLLYGAQTGTFDLEWSGDGHPDPLMLLIHRSGQAPDPPIDVADVGVMQDLPIGPWETVVVQIIGEGEILDAVEVTTVADVPPLDCAVVVCGFGLDEVVYPDWVEVSLHVEDVRAVSVVVTRDRDRRVITRTALGISDGIAGARLTGLAPGTAYTTEYVVVDDFGHATTVVVGGFETER